MSRHHAGAVRSLAVAIAVVVIAGLSATVVLVDRSWAADRPHHALQVPGPPPAPAPVVPAGVEPSAPAGPPPSLIATLSAATSYSAAPGGSPTGTLTAANPFGAPQVLAVIGEQGEGPGSWLHVELPIRPNGSTGWIPASSARLTQTGYRVAVSLSARTLTVTDSGRPVLTTPVAVGKASTPTPPDTTYLWELIRPDDPNGPYGPYIFGLAEYSDAYSVFNGGDAQIGIHGQDEPWSIGLAASNGCVRLPNNVITELAGMLPLGTPVDLS